MPKVLIATLANFLPHFRSASAGGSLEGDKGVGGMGFPEGSLATLRQWNRFDALLHGMGVTMLRCVCAQCIRAPLILES